MLSCHERCGLSHIWNRGKAGGSIVNASVVGIIVFACTFAGALLGMWLRTVLPKHHFDTESRDTVKVGIGLIATMTALVLGLVTASAKSSFDDVNTAVKHSATQVLALDRALARYGPETGEIREGLQHAVGARIDMIWPQDSSKAASLDPTRVSGVEGLADAIRGLKPHDDAQRALQARALDLAEALLTSEVACDRRHRGVSSGAVPCGAPVLAHDHVRELRVVCSAERAGCHGPLRLCTVGW